MTFVWPMRPIGELVAPINRQEMPEPGVNYRQIGVRWWGEGVYERESVDGGVTLYKTFNRIQSDDIVYNKIWARHGSVSVVPKELDGCYCSAEFPLHRVKDELLDTRWFYWLTKCRWFWGKCDEQSRGTSGKNRIRPEQFLAIKIPLPSLAEQRRIVVRIEAIATRVDEGRRLRQEIQNDAKVLLHSVFHRFIQGAAYRPLAEVAPIVRRPVAIELDASYEEIGIRSFHKGPFFKCVSLGADISHKAMFQMVPGDLVFSNIMAWEGGIAVVRPEDQGRIGVHRFITCIPRPGVADAQFLWFYFQTKQGFEKIVAASPATIARNRTLSVKKLEAIKVPVPTYDKQEAFAILQRKISAIHQTQAASQPELDALLPAVLDKAFKGEL